MNARARILLGIGLFACGLLAGRIVPREAAGVSTPAEEHSVPVSRRNSENRTKSQREEVRNLVTLEKDYKNRITRGGELSDEMARLPVSELKDLLLEQMALSGEGTGKERNARQRLISIALAELYHREGTAAFEWVAALPDPHWRRGALHNVLTLAMGEHPDAAMPWLRKYQAETGNDPVDLANFAAEALAASATSGVDEMLRVIGLFPGNFRVDPLHSTRFPANFDFTKLHASLSGRTDMPSIYDQWGAQDRDAAWQGMKGDLSLLGQDAGKNFGSLVLGAVTRNGEEDGMTWAAERLAELTHENRQSCLSNIDTLGKLTAEGVAHLSRSLPPEDRKSLAAGVLTTSPENGEKIKAVLDVLPREQLIEVLQAGNVRYAKSLDAPTSSRLTKATRETFLDLETHFSLTPDELQRVRGARTTFPR